MTPLAERIIRNLSPEQKEQRLGEALTALDSVTDPKGHFLHRDNEQCTGECVAIRKALREGSGKPQCLTPGCNQDHNHVTPHGDKQVIMRELGDALPKKGRQDWQPDVYARQKVPDYVSSGPTGDYGSFREVPHVPQYTNLPSRVTLEGLASVIGSLTGALSALYGANYNSEAHEAAHALRVLSVKVRELAGCKDETASDDEEVSVGSPSMVMTPEQMKELLADHLRQHQALLVKEDDATYNRAITDAHNAMADELGDTTVAEKYGVRAQAAIRKLYRNNPAPAVSTPDRQEAEWMENTKIGLEQRLHRLQREAEAK